MQTLYRHKETEGYCEIVGETSVLELIRFGLIRLDKHERVSLVSGEYEAGLVIMSGKCDIVSEGWAFTSLGKRKDVFSGRPTSVYIPRQSSYQVIATGDGMLEIGVCMARADRTLEPFVVSPSAVVLEHRGSLNWQRDVEDIIVSEFEDRVDKIIVGETYSYPGQWSSYPPHKHDRDYSPHETRMEELYHFRVNPAQGFGIQLLYQDDISDCNECFPVMSGDTVAIKSGYHPVVAAPGYQLYYLWVMAGKNGRTLRPYDDPKHAWLRAVEIMVK
jgi:5-deoxy-glucuronate isomerase